MTQEELQEKIKEYNEQIKFLEKQADLAHKSQFKNKLMKVFGLSTIPYIILIFSYVILLSKGIITTLNYIPTEFVSLAIVTGSLTIGSIGYIINDIKEKRKDKLKAFTNVTKEADLLQEEVKSIIEIIELKAKKKIIQKIIHPLYNLKRNNEILPMQTKEEILESLNKNNNELDILIKQKVLFEQFSDEIYENLSDSIFYKIIYGIFGGIVMDIVLFLPFVPNAFTGFYANNSLISVLLNLIGPFAIGTIASTVYKIKCDSDTLKAYNKLNNELGEYALSYDQIINMDEKEFNDKIKATMKQIIKDQIELAKQDMIMEILPTENDKKEMPHVTLSKKIVSRDEPLCSSTNDINPEENAIPKKNGPSLVLKRNKNYNN